MRRRSPSPGRSAPHLGRTPNPSACASIGSLAPPPATAQRGGWAPPPPGAISGNAVPGGASSGTGVALARAARSFSRARCTRAPPRSTAGHLSVGGPQFNSAVTGTRTFTEGACPGDGPQPGLSPLGDCPAGGRDRPAAGPRTRRSGRRPLPRTPRAGEYEAPPSELLSWWVLVRCAAATVAYSISRGRRPTARRSHRHRSAGCGTRPGTAWHGGRADCCCAAVPRARRRPWLPASRPVAPAWSRTRSSRCTLSKRSSSRCEGSRSSAGTGPSRPSAAASGGVRSRAVRRSGRSRWALRLACQGRGVGAPPGCRCPSPRWLPSLPCSSSRRISWRPALALPVTRPCPSFSPPPLAPLFSAAGPGVPNWAGRAHLRERLLLLLRPFLRVAQPRRRQLGPGEPRPTLPGIVRCPAAV